jgi:hypothetical protein
MGQLASVRRLPIGYGSSRPIAGARSHKMNAQKRTFHCFGKLGTVYDKSAIVTAFFIAVVVSAVLFAGFAIATEHSGLQSPEYFVALLLVGLQFSMLAAIVVALPAFIALQHSGLVNAAWSVIAGSVAGFIAAVLTEWPSGSAYALLHLSLTDHSVVRALAFAAIGATSGIAFWIFLTRTRPRAIR